MFKRWFLVEAVRSKKGFPFHSIMLSLMRVKFSIGGKWGKESSVL